MIEDGGKYFLPETQNLEGLWTQFDSKTVAATGLLADLAAPLPASVRAPALPAFLRRSSRMDYGREDLRAGFSADLWVRFASLAAD